MINLISSLIFIFKSGNEDAFVKPVSFTRILKLNSPEWRYLVIGCFGAALYGAYPSLFGLAFGGIYEVSSFCVRGNNVNSCVLSTLLIKWLLASSLIHLLVFHDQGFSYIYIYI